MKKSDDAKSENKSGFIKTWGRVFKELGTQGKDRVILEMKKLCPDKKESIEKWVEWYKAYYNMGKILGHENPQKISWK